MHSRKCNIFHQADVIFGVPEMIISVFVQIGLYLTNNYNSQVVVLIKCVCQLQIVWWNQSPITTNPMAPARIIGIEQKPNYASYDLALLMVIFFHR